MNIKKVFSKKTEQWLEYAPERTGSSRYFISNHGRVKSINSVGAEKLIKTCSIGNGFQMLSIRNGKSKLNVYIHKFVALNFVSRPDLTYTRIWHKDMDRSNNHFNNIEWRLPEGKNTKLKHDTKLKIVSKPILPESKSQNIMLSDTKIFLVQKRLGKAKNATIARTLKIPIEYVNKIQNGEICAKVI